MAQFGVQRAPANMLALFTMLAFLLLIAYAAFTGTKMGGRLYLLGLAAIILGFWTKEDSVAIGGVIGLNFLVILDILLHIGLLG